MAAGACGGRGSSAPGHVEAGWSSPTGSALTLCLRTEGSTARDRGFSTSRATRSPATTMMVRVRSKQVKKKTFKLLSASLAKHQECDRDFAAPFEMCNK